MLGNVWEFRSTRYGPYPKGPVTDPMAGDPKRGFAVRGGGWSNIAKDARCATRNADPPHFCHSNLGFRVALLLQKQQMRSPNGATVNSQGRKSIARGASPWNR
jgi:formylglycine-generating enzyme required for sulfatase activity